MNTGHSIVSALAHFYQRLVQSMQYPSSVAMVEAMRSLCAVAKPEAHPGGKTGYTVRYALALGDGKVSFDYDVPLAQWAPTDDPVILDNQRQMAEAHVATVNEGLHHLAYGLDKFEVREIERAVQKAVHAMKLAANPEVGPVLATRPAAHAAPIAAQARGAVAPVGVPAMA